MSRIRKFLLSLAMFSGILLFLLSAGLCIYWIFVQKGMLSDPKAMATWVHKQEAQIKTYAPGLHKRIMAIPKPKRLPFTLLAFVVLLFLPTFLLFTIWRFSTWMLFESAHQYSQDLLAETMLQRPPPQTK